MILIFVLGYTAIALEHTIKIDKAASALFIGVMLWTLFMLDSVNILNLGFSPGWIETEGKLDITHFIVEELEHHLIEIAEILFFLLGAMTIVEVVDQHEGFKIITDRINAKKKSSLLWILGIITFFMSAALDNLTTTIVMIALLRKLIEDKKTRWIFASIIVIAANAGGAWSPIGDVTTIMLWIGGQITAMAIIKGVLLPSIMNLVVPLGILSFILQGNVEKPAKNDDEKEFTSARHRKIIFCIGIGA
ncbi:MAG TPA: sodium:proton antiporter NhaD, partial [Bacteroidales bacterium]|nr:sodium:proton antiporter NhaD [Bacteroidales bacterium]